jgi:hypothetical protein
MSLLRAFRAASLTVGIWAASAAGAATLHTPPAVALDLGGTLYCQIRNVGRKPTAVTVEGIGFGGVVITSHTATLAPGQGISRLGGTGAALACRFQVSGSAKSARAAAVYWDGTHFTQALPAR